MSDHFIWTLSLHLDPEVPGDVLAGVRYLLGLGPGPAVELPVSEPVFAVPDPRHDWLPGGSVSSLVRQRAARSRPLWGVHVRAFLLDDTAYDAMVNVLPWLARWTRTAGWIGGMREEFDLRSWEGWDFFAADGNAYLAKGDSGIAPITPNAPEFTLSRTSAAFE